MNIFVLNSGRCGSTTFARACSHITNYSVGHESRACLPGADRLAYPEDHIEADNRLSWLLGRLDAAYGNDAFYVHLIREPDATARSFTRRESFGIMKAYREGILMGGQEGQSSYALAMDYLDTVQGNIELFLKDKDKKMVFRLENAPADFSRFWQLAGATGDLQKALGEWGHAYNASA